MKSNLNYQDTKGTLQVSVLSGLSEEKKNLTETGFIDLSDIFPRKRRLISQ